jgi:hypothetical protein
MANLARITGHGMRITTDKQNANTLLVFDRAINLRALADSLIPEEHLSDEFHNSAVCFATFTGTTIHLFAKRWLSYPSTGYEQKANYRAASSKSLRKFWA